MDEEKKIEYEKEILYRAVDIRASSEKNKLPEQKAKDIFGEILSKIRDG